MMFQRLRNAEWLHTYARTRRRYSTAPPRPSLFRSHISSLRARYPSADAPSLIASFLILHELTAMLPLGLGFWGLKAAGVGDKFVGWVKEHEVVEGTDEAGVGHWVRVKVGEWILEGERRAERAGRRYGILGYEKESKEEREERKLRHSNGVPSLEEASTTTRIGGDVANLIVAYVAVKALLPLRLMLSARLAPPMANMVVSRFKTLRSIGAKYMKKQAS